MGLLLGNTETFQNVQDCFALYFKLSGQIIDSNFHPLSSFLSKLYVIISTSRRNFACANLSLSALLQLCPMTLFRPVPRSQLPQYSQQHARPRLRLPPARWFHQLRPAPLPPLGLHRFALPALQRLPGSPALHRPEPLPGLNSNY